MRLLQHRGGKREDTVARETLCNLLSRRRESNQISDEGFVGGFLGGASSKKDMDSIFESRHAFGCSWMSDMHTTNNLFSFYT